MNIEKLYNISIIILNDFSKHSISSHLQAMVTHLQNTINQPQQPNHQQAFSKAKTELYKGLNNASSNKFNIIDISACEELGIYEFLGEKLLNKTENIFLANEITPSIAHEELTSINNSVIKGLEALTKITQAFKELEIENIDDKEDFKLIVRIPRTLIDNNLSGFSSSVESLNANLLVFSEVSTGTRSSLEINSLSTSDPTLVLTLLWDTGMLMLDILSKIAAIYAGVTVLKQQRQKLIDSGAPEETLDALTTWIGNQVKEKINEEIPPLVDKYYPTVDDNHRKNELKIEIRRKALRIAENIDNGYTYDINAPEIPDENDPEIIAAVNESIRQLNFNSKLIEENKIIGNNILALPDSDEDL